MATRCKFGRRGILYFTIFFHNYPRKSSHHFPIILMFPSAPPWPRPKVDVPTEFPNRCRSRGSGAAGGGTWPGKYLGGDHWIEWVYIGFILGLCGFK